MSFKIYKVNEYKGNIEIKELEAIKETEYFFIIPDDSRWSKTKQRRIQKGSDNDCFFKTPEEAVQNRLNNIGKVINQLTDRLSRERKSMDALEKFIAEREKEMV